ncbi:hypothetical protein SAMN05444166_8047 [Singulisphaera sp. GP187]|nr:hypothetical protein SAMN05444166_8047 [Singulisphaera sp. GP187]
MPVMGRIDAAVAAIYANASPKATKMRVHQRASNLAA